MTLTKPSSNWLALKKNLAPPRKQLKTSHGDLSSASLSDKTPAFPRKASPLAPKRHDPGTSNEHVDLKTTEVKNGESIAALRRMVLGKVEYKTSQTASGKYLALDCEMVGVGIEGNESSLARVSIVNYTGAIVLDVFVRQREKVVDYRTQWSGVRSTDLVGSAKPFKEVQQTVADLIKDRILVGHAIYNDLKALLLSHPSPQIRDTQSLAYKHRIVKSRRPALRVLVKQELDIVIQGGEHSSVTDARATMALLRLYKKQWESSFRSVHATSRSHSKTKANDKDTAAVQRSPSRSISARKRKRSELSESDDDGDDDDDGAAEAPNSSPGHQVPSRTSHNQDPMPHTPSPSKRPIQRSRSSSTDSARRKGISSGISTVARKAGGIKEVRVGSIVQKGRVSGSKGKKKTGPDGDKWWKSLGGGKKDSIKL